MVILILDNGAGSAKIGFDDEDKPRIVPNCVTKAKTVRTRCFIGDEIDDCKDMSGLYYLLPFQKGYLVNWEIEKQVWDYMFGSRCMQVDFADTDLIITEPVFNFNTVQEAMGEILFEEYQFRSVYCCNASHLSQYKYRQERKTPKPLCTLVVDSGYSFTHIVPYFKGKRISKLTKRIDVGGKVLTNHLKEITSYRQLNVMDEAYVMNQCKEDICFVSQDYRADVDIARKRGSDNTITMDYVLPDYTHVKRGFVRKPEEHASKNTHEQIIKMNNERFTVPEILFRPSDISIEQIGIAEAIVHVINLALEDMRPHFSANILLTGGNCKFRGFKDRLYNDVRSMIDSFYDVSMELPETPITYAWEGGKLFAQDPNFSQEVLTKERYEEEGSNSIISSFVI